jgi:hypothetical protein
MSVADFRATVAFIRRWQAGMGTLLAVVDYNGPPMFARIGVIAVTERLGGSL